MFEGNKLSNRGIRRSFFVGLATFLLIGSSVPVTAAQATTVPALQGVGYLQGARQEQMLCPGGALQGKLKEAIIEPFAVKVALAGDCNLADMKAANPNTKFLAYLNIAVALPRDETLGAWSDFQTTCVNTPKDATDPANKYFVESNSEKLKEAGAIATVAGKNYVRYPDFGGQLLVSNIASAAFVSACQARIGAILSKPSQPGISGAPAARFDGVMFDDANMSPQHGINPEQVGSYGPWVNSAQYGDDMVRTLGTLSRQAKTSAGRPVQMWVNLGVDIFDSLRQQGTAVNSSGAKIYSVQRERALSLGALKMQPGVATAMPVMDAVLREFTTQWGNGAWLNDNELTAQAAFSTQFARLQVRAILHDYNVDLRNVPSTSYSQGNSVPTAACLKKTDYNAAATAAAAKIRRTAEQRLNFAWALLSRASTSNLIEGTLTQAAPTCQQQYPSAATPMYESVTTASVDLEDPMFNTLKGMQLSSVYGSGPIVTVTGNQVKTRLLSNGWTVVVNTGASAANYAYKGVNYSIPARDARVIY